MRRSQPFSTALANQRISDPAFNHYRLFYARGSDSILSVAERASGGPDVIASTPLAGGPSTIVFARPGGVALDAVHSSSDLMLVTVRIDDTTTQVGVVDGSGAFTPKTSGPGLKDGVGFGPGDTVLFTRTLESGDEVFDRLFRSDGAQPPIPLTPPGVDVGGAAVTDDGAEVFYARVSPDGTQVHVARTDGSGDEALTSGPGIRLLATPAQGLPPGAPVPFIEVDDLLEQYSMKAYWPGHGVETYIQSAPSMLGDLRLGPEALAVKGEVYITTDSGVKICILIEKAGASAPVVAVAGGYPLSYTPVDTETPQAAYILIDPATGEAAIYRTESGECYADCDDSGSLDFFDFLCFQNSFAASEPYADCDGSGGHDFFDFLCFQDAFAAGCP